MTNSHSHEACCGTGRPAETFTTDPAIVEVTRGPMVESRHRVAVAVVDAHGRILLRAGDIERPVYPRSAVKPLQALALIETGAADRFGLTDAELALACASHNGERRHVELIGSWLERVGCSELDLECGPQWPAGPEAMRELILGGCEPSQMHNNCSGKHAGFLTVARHLGHPTKGYIRHEHPVQQRVLGTLEQICGLDLDRAPRGVDGCGIPVFGIPLGNIALAMARLADPHEQPELRQNAAARLLQAMAAEPLLVAGTGRFCSRVMAVTGRHALVKTGAEGVFCGILPELGLGIALKTEDGAARAAELVMVGLLRRFGILGEAETEQLRDLLEPPILNRIGLEVGAIRLAEDALKA